MSTSTTTQQQEQVKPEEQKQEQHQKQNQSDNTGAVVRTLLGPSDKVFNEKEYPGLQETEWQRFYGTLNSNKMKHIAKLAEQTRFKIRIKNDHGKYVTIEKEFQDPTVQEWQTLEDMRAEYADMLREDSRVVAKIAKWAETTKNLENPPPIELTKEERESRRKCAAFLAGIQKVGAKILLDLSEEQFLRSDYRSASDAVDACNHRVQYAVLPNGEET